MDYEEIDLDELVDALNNNVKDDIKSFEDIVSLSDSLSRNLYLGDIVYGVGQSLDSYIRFWNRYDDDHNIPIEERDPIRIFINSNGGDLNETLIMIDAIELSKTPVWTIVTGAAYSGGFFTAIAGHRRFTYPHASFLYHEGSAQNGGTSSQFENFSMFYKKQLKQLEQHVLKHTKITKEKYDEIHKEDIWMTAEEAIEDGCVDEIFKELI